MNVGNVSDAVRNGLVRNGDGNRTLHLECEPWLCFSLESGLEKALWLPVLATSRAHRACVYFGCRMGPSVLCSVTTGIHVLPIPNPPPFSLPTPSLWVVPVHQPQASSIVHRTWTGNSFHTRYFTCFNAILPNLPTLSLSHRVHKTVLYISVSFAVSYTGLLLPSF